MGQAPRCDSHLELARLIHAVEVELDANIEVVEQEGTPTTPHGGRLIRLTHRGGLPEGWLRVTPRGRSVLDPDSGRLLRVLTTLLHHNLNALGGGRDVSAATIRAVLLNEDLRIVYQPIYDLYANTVVGYEALSRFPEPPSKTPDRWFADAAAIGLGTALEVLAIKHALRALHELPEHTYLSVNISPAAATSPELEALLADVPVHRVVLEITEHAEVDDYEALNSAIAKLRRRGARLAVDDTGSGFASMRHVLRLAPDIVKLDTTLTQDIDNNAVLRALGFSLKSFAAAIDAQVVAEGIETEREVDALRFLGVRYGQGFHLARPSPLEDHIPARV